MIISGKIVDYTDRDFDAIRLRLRNLISSVFPTWTDFNVADFGNILLELFAHSTDVLTFYQDNQAKQSRLSTATQRRALLGLVKLIGYVPTTATAATAEVVVSIPSPTAGDVIFPAGTVIRTNEVTEPLEYQLVESAIIPAGGLVSALTQAENSETKVVGFEASGLPNQTFLLPSTPFIDGSIGVTAGNGAFEQVENFLNSTSSDAHFVVTVDQNDRATVRFGNGVNGRAPTGTATFTYKTGGGTQGRVEANRLRNIPGTWTDTLGSPVNPVVTNPEPSAGGTDRQTVAQIKERAPSTLRVLSRSVTKEDFEINALRLADVARALMLTRNEDSAIGENRGQLYIVPVGGGLPSQTLKDAVLHQVTVEYPKTITFGVDVLDPVYRDLNFTIVVFFKQGVNRPAAAGLIRSALAAFFDIQNADGTANDSIDFGGRLTNGDGVVTGELALSDLENVVRDLSVVRKLGTLPSDFLVNGAHTDIFLAGREFPRLGNVVIIDGESGDQL